MNNLDKKFDDTIKNNSNFLGTCLSVKISDKDEQFLDCAAEFEKITNKYVPASRGPANFEKLSDKDLYSYCKTVGFNARIWSRKFIATIPEVAKRRLYKKYRYCSIHEFAAKLAGVSQKNTDDVLWISEKFKEMPRMKELIGEVGLSKLKVVACIATKETDDFWAQKVKNLTKSSLEIYVKEIRMRVANSNGVVNNNKTKILDLQGRIVEKFPGELSVENIKFPFAQEQIGMFDFEKSISQNINNARVENSVMAEVKFQKQIKKTFAIQIDEETEFELRKFKQKLEKTKKEPVDWNSALKEMVKSALNEKLNEKKVQFKKSQPDVKSATARGAGIKPEIVVDKQMGSAKQKPVSRYIPAKIKHNLLRQFKDRCAYKGCNKPAEQIHHNVRFAKKPNHENLTPLCKEHHDFLHQISHKTVDIKFNTFKRENFAAEGR